MNALTELESVTISSWSTKWLSLLPSDDMDPNESDLGVGVVVATGETLYFPPSTPLDKESLDFVVPGEEILAFSLYISVDETSFASLGNVDLDGSFPPINMLSFPEFLLSLICADDALTTVISAE